MESPGALDCNISCSCGCPSPTRHGGDLVLAPAADDRPALDTAMPSLADTVLATLHEEDRRLDLVTRFRLQMVTGRWSVVIRAAKSPFVEINYGTPEPVAYETIADAGAPLKITILSDSAIDIPTRPIS